MLNHTFFKFGSFTKLDSFLFLGDIPLKTLSLRGLFPKNYTNILMQHTDVGDLAQNDAL